MGEVFYIIWSGFPFCVNLQTINKIFARATQNFTKI